MWARVWGLPRLANINPTAAEVSLWFNRTRPVPLAAELLGGVSCAPLSAAAKRFGAGEIDPAVSLSMIVIVAVDGAARLPPVALLRVRLMVSAGSTKASSTIRTEKVLLISPAAKLSVPVVTV